MKLHMRNLFLTFFMVLFGAIYTNAQTVTTFAGVENTSNPWENVDNSSISVDQAHFYEPSGIGWDSDGNMYVAERNKIRLIKGTTVYNRSGAQGDASFSLGYKNGTGNAAAYYAPTSVVCDANRDAFIVDSENHAIRKLTKFGSIGSGQIASTFAGAAPVSNFGTSGDKNGTGTAARFNSPKGIVLASDGNFYVTDFGNHMIRKMTAGAVVSTIAGQSGTAGSSDGMGTAATYSLPYGVAEYDANNIVITDFGNSSVRMLNIITGKTTTVAGKSGSVSITNGTLDQARFRAPRGIAVVNGLIYVADEGTIRVIDIPNDTVFTFAGSATSAGNKDGVGPDARFGRLGEVAYDGGYTLYVTDIYYNVIRAVTIDNLIPVADFVATKTSLEVNENTILTDISTGATATTRKWTIKDVGGSAANIEFVSGDPNSSQVLTVRFKATGFYSVTLSITNDYGADQITKTDFINVSVTGAISNVDAERLVQIYPNPASNETIHIESELFKIGNTSISILNTQGQIVRQIETQGASKLSIPSYDLNAGVYFVQMNTDQGIVSKKLIIE